MAATLMRRLYAIIGDPIGQVRSPELFNARFAERGIDAEMVALEVGAADFAAVLDGLRRIRNFGGAVVTVPHKLAAAMLATLPSPRVALTGAANVLKPDGAGWRADLLDGIGFVAGLAAQGITVAEMQAAIVGAGGAGLAIAEALLAADAVVAIWDRDRDRAEIAVQRLAAVHPGRIRLRLPGGSDQLVVNATPLGMAPDDPLPIDLDALSPAALVAEVIMKPPVTRLLAEAARRGHPVHEGRHMLDGQVEAIAAFLAMDDPGQPDFALADGASASASAAKR